MFKNLIKNNIKKYMIKHAKKYQGVDNYCHFSVDIDFSDSPNAYVRLKRDRYHNSATFINTDTFEIVNAYFYQLIYNNKYKEELNFYNDLMAFYEWFYTSVVKRQEIIKEFVNYSNLSDILNYYNLQTIFDVIFKNKIIDNINETKTPSELKHFILNFDKYKKLYILNKA